VVKRFEKIVKAAGFGKERRHSVEISMTEAEAAAVYTAWSMRHSKFSDNDRLQEDNVVLVCDCGGGTTARIPLHSSSSRSRIFRTNVTSI
jgi:hypothetical protein